MFCSMFRNKKVIRVEEFVLNVGLVSKEKNEAHIEFHM